MKLEIRHLAPYLSYKLKAINCLNDVTEIIGLQLKPKESQRTLVVG